MGLFDSWNVTNFKVVLAQEEVLAGQYVSGNVQFDVTEDMPFRRIYVDVWGQEFAVVEVTTNSGDNIGSSRTYTQQCRVFAHQITLLGQHATKDTKSSDLPKLTLKRGYYDFPFAVQIPVDTPPTIRQHIATSAAQVTYKVAAVLDVPFTFSDPQAISEFSVITPMPIGQAQGSRPSTATGSAPRFTCGCCSAGSTSCTVDVDRNIILFGQDDAFVDVAVTIDNSNSETDVGNISISLRRRCWVTASGYETVLSQLICDSQISTKMEAGEGSRRFSARLSIPPTFRRQYGPGYCGTLMVQHFEVSVMSGRQVLGVVGLCGADSVDETNTAPQIPTIAGKGAKRQPRQVYFGPDYPRLVYTAPPGASPQLPGGMEIHIPRPSAKVDAMRYSVVEASATGFSHEPVSGTVVHSGVPPAAADASTPLISKKCA